MQSRIWRHLPCSAYNVHRLNVTVGDASDVITDAPGYAVRTSPLVTQHLSPMFPPLSVLTHIANQVLVILASPAQKPLEPSPRPPPRQLFDVQVSVPLPRLFYVLTPRIAGSSRRQRKYYREHTPQLRLVCSTKTSSNSASHICSRGLIDGATTLELDNGITKVSHRIACLRRIWADTVVRTAL